jgi:hypothetical protein
VVWGGGVGGGFWVERDGDGWRGYGRVVLGGGRMNHSLPNIFDSCRHDSIQGSIPDKNTELLLLHDLPYRGGRGGCGLGRMVLPTETIVDVECKETV